jgi:hypothetical protein
MLGDFDWDELETVGRAKAGTWFVLFMIFVNILLLNMLLAIVMDAYSDVKSNAKNAQTLGAQVRVMRRRSVEKRRGLRIGLTDVSKAFKIKEPYIDIRMNSQEMLDKQVLMDIVFENCKKNLPHSQAIRVLTNAREWWREQQQEEEEIKKAENEDSQDDIVHRGLSLLTSEVHKLEEQLMHNSEMLDPTANENTNPKADYSADGGTLVDLKEIGSQIQILQKQQGELKAEMTEMKLIAQRQDAMMDTISGQIRDLANSISRVNTMQQVSQQSQICAGIGVL